MYQNASTSRILDTSSQGLISSTGTPPLTRFFGPEKNRVKGKPRYRRSILVLKPQNGEFESSKSTFLRIILGSFNYFNVISGECNKYHLKIGTKIVGCFSNLVQL